MIDFDDGNDKNAALVERKNTEKPKGSIRLKVIGLGGGGSNAVDKMLENIDVLRTKKEEARMEKEIAKYSWIDNIELIVANTDEQALEQSTVAKKIQLGPMCSEGLGAGSDPLLGEQAAIESQEEITEAIDGARLLFIAACMGGGTGTGAAPVVARIAREAREKKIHTLAVVSKPYISEGIDRIEKAEAGIVKLRKEVDCLVVIPNENVSRLVSREVSAFEAYKIVDQTLSDTVLNIAALVYQTGYINADLRDLINAMSFNGVAMVGYGEGEGENRAQQAVDNALSSPLLENINLSNAKSVLFGIWAADLLYSEEQLIVGTINQVVNRPDTKRKHGLYADPSMGKRIKVFIFATGLDQEQSNYVEKPVEQAHDEPEKPAWDVPDFA